MGRQSPSRTALWLSAAALVLAAIGAWFVVRAIQGDENTTSVGQGSGSVAALRGRPDPQDRLLTSRQFGPQLPPMVSHPERARLAATVGGRRLFIAPADGQGICLIEVSRHGIDVATCNPRERLRHQAVVLTEPRGRSMTVSGIAPDGFSTVDVAGETGRIHNNVFFLAKAPLATALKIMGPGAERTVHLGRQLPPENATTTTVAG
jgi:hypothetical protein